MFYGGLAPSLKVKTPKALKGGRGEGVNEGYKGQLRSIALCALSPCYLGLIPSGPPTARRPYSYFMFMGEKQGAGLLDPMLPRLSDACPRDRGARPTVGT